MLLLKLIPTVLPSTRNGTPIVALVQPSEYTVLWNTFVFDVLAQRIPHSAPVTRMKLFATNGAPGFVLDRACKYKPGACVLCPPVKFSRFFSNRKSPMLLAMFTPALIPVELLVITFRRITNPSVTFENIAPA
jgi:hypothetical protein